MKFVYGIKLPMNAAQTTSYEQLESENQKLRNEVAHLNEQLAWFKRQVFGKRAETIVKTLDNSVLVLPGFEEFYKEHESQLEKKEEKRISSHTRRTPENKGKDKITIPEDLPVERIDLDIPEEEKTCSETGLSLVKIGEEISRKLAHVPESFYVKEYIRPIYAMPKGAEEGIRVAELPDSIIPKCRADESLLAEIITKKFADHLPLYRMSEAFSRIDIQISRQLLSQWVVRVGLALKPLYDLMLKNILKSENVFIDESPISMLMPGKGKVHQAFMWSATRG
jgi:transposase